MIRTPDQRVRVFVSSTMRELAAEREAVTAAVTQLRLTPVLFELGARPYPPRDLYRAYLKQSDVFIGIYAESYGWVAPGMEISGLEDEYRLSAGMPRLIYVKKVPQTEPRLTSFLNTIQAEGVVSYRSFKGADELGSLVADDLALLLTDRFAGQPASQPATSVAPLPVPRWALVDRVEELQVVTGLLLGPETGLVTLTGPGGVGKTSLALAAAHAVADQFADGAAFVSLEALTDTALIYDTVAQQLHIPTPPSQTLVESLLAFFTPRQMLVVVDNVEQLLSAAPIAERILELAPRLRVLATSREPLRIRGEKVVPVAPLALPEPGAPLDPGRLAAVPAVAFFAISARDAQPGFEALAVWSRITTTYGQPFDAYLRYYLGSVALVQGDGDTAGAQLAVSLRELEAAGDGMARGVVLGSLGLLAAQGGEHAQAQARFAEGLPLLRQGGDEWDLAMLLLNSGLEEARAASATAGPLLIEALQAWQRLGRAVGIAFALAGLGEVAAASGAPRRAGQLLGASQFLLPAIDPMLRLVVPYDLPATVTAARAGGDPVAFDRGLAEGRAWTIDEAVAAGLASPANAAGLASPANPGTGPQ